MSGYRTALPVFVDSLPIGIYRYHTCTGMQLQDLGGPPPAAAVEAIYLNACPEVIIYERDGDGWRMRPDLR